jgi:uncharacterized protein YacL
VKEKNLFALLMAHFRLDKIQADLEGYLITSVEIAKLDIQNYLARLTYNVAKLLVMTILFLLAGFFLGLATAFLLGQWLDNIGLGFVLVGSFNLCLMLLFWIFRNLIRKNIRKQVMEHFSQTLLAPKPLADIITQDLLEDNENPNNSTPSHETQK